MRLTQIIEALLFASDAPLTAADLARVDERLDEDTVQAVIEELRGEFDATERSFQIYEMGGGYQILTRPEFMTYLERYDTVPRPARVSASALEVLAILAYRQPIGRLEVEEIRGVSSSGVIRTLQDRGLIEAVGRSEGMGRPLLYGTTRKFLEHFGFRSLEDLPRPDELPVVLRSRSLEVQVDEPEPADDAAGQTGAPPAADEVVEVVDVVAGDVAEPADSEVVASAEEPAADAEIVASDDAEPADAEDMAVPQSAERTEG
jgi:segregation and condensation protein B